MLKKNLKLQALKIINYQADPNAVGANFSGNRLKKKAIACRLGKGAMVRSLEMLVKGTC